MKWCWWVLITCVGLGLVVWVGWYLLAELAIRTQ
jgi:hypothetical protein